MARCYEYQIISLCIKLSAQSLLESLHQREEHTAPHCRWMCLVWVNLHMTTNMAGSCSGLWINSEAARNPHAGTTAHAGHLLAYPGSEVGGTLGPSASSFVPVSHGKAQWGYPLRPACVSFSIEEFPTRMHNNYYALKKNVIHHSFWKSCRHSTELTALCWFLFII